MQFHPDLLLPGTMNRPVDMEFSRTRPDPVAHLRYANPDISGGFIREFLPKAGHISEEPMAGHFTGEAFWDHVPAGSSDPAEWLFLAMTAMLSAQGKNVALADHRPGSMPDSAGTSAAPTLDGEELGNGTLPAPALARDVSTKAVACETPFSLRTGTQEGTDPAAGEVIPGAGSPGVGDFSLDAGQEQGSAIGAPALPVGGSPQALPSATSFATVKLAEAPDSTPAAASADAEAPLKPAVPIWAETVLHAASKSPDFSSGSGDTQPAGEDARSIGTRPPAEGRLAHAPGLPQFRSTAPQDEQAPADRAQPDLRAAMQVKNAAPAEAALHGASLAAKSGPADPEQAADPTRQFRAAIAVSGPPSLPEPAPSELVATSKDASAGVQAETEPTPRSGGSSPGRDLSARRMDWYAPLPGPLSGADGVPAMAATVEKTAPDHSNNPRLSGEELRLSTRQAEATPWRHDIAASRHSPHTIAVADRTVPNPLAPEEIRGLDTFISSPGLQTAPDPARPLNDEEPLPPLLTRVSEQSHSHGTKLAEPPRVVFSEQNVSLQNSPGSAARLEPGAIAYTRPAAFGRLRVDLDVPPNRDLIELAGTGSVAVREHRGAAGSEAARSTAGTELTQVSSAAQPDDPLPGRHDPTAFRPEIESRIGFAPTSGNLSQTRLTATADRDPAATPSRRQPPEANADDGNFLLPQHSATRRQHDESGHGRQDTAHGHGTTAPASAEPLGGSAAPGTATPEPGHRADKALPEHPSELTAVPRSDLRADPARSEISTQPAASAPGTRSETAEVMRQLMDEIRARPDRGFELILRPEELGRLRFDMRPGADGLSVHISADRPETLDLVRRNLDELARELRSLGHGAISFGFSGSDGRRAGHHAAERVLVERNPEMAIATTMPRGNLRAAGGGLDLRL